MDPAFHKEITLSFERSQATLFKSFEASQKKKLDEFFGHLKRDLDQFQVEQETWILDFIGEARQAWEMEQ